MKAGDWKMTVETLESGQRRPYADSVYRYRVFFSWLPYQKKPEAGGTDWWEPVSWTEEVIRPKLQAVKLHYEMAQAPSPFHPIIEELKKVGPGTWEFTVRELFTD